MGHRQGPCRVVAVAGCGEGSRDPVSDPQAADHSIRPDGVGRLSVENLHFQVIK